ncbi:hypothetical protein JCM14469_36160 [Desulfatiferula olefinivorans]
MHALLVVAHGSRAKESNEEVIRLAESLNRRPDSGFDTVICAFNQFSEPTAEQQIRVLADRGATTITVLPYFIAAGSHVRVDLPELVETARSAYPQIRFRLSPHFGAFRGVADLIVGELSEGRSA